MAENADTAFVNLKRKIIAVDKLKKHITKTDSKIAELNKKLEEKDKHILEKENEVTKLKADLLESLVSSGSGNVSSDEIEDLKKKVDEKQKLLDSKSHQVSSLQIESNAKSKKVESLESDLKKLKGKYAGIEKDLKSKNENIIQRELESQGLKQQIEDLKREKKSLETSMKSGQHLDDVKRTYEESKWKNLAEISKLKQESNFLEKQVKELEENSEAVKKTNIELRRQIASNQNQIKLSENLEKSLDKRDKNILSLEKKLAQALQDNEKLKSRLKNKHIEIPVAKPLTQLFEDSRTAEDENMEKEHEEESDCEIIEEAEEKPFMRFLSYSFSNPKSRFQIVRPKPPTKTKLNFLFTKKATTIDTIPNVFNVTPRISDHFPKLSHPQKRLRKRKHTDDRSSTADVKRQRSGQYNSNVYLSEPLSSNTSLMDSTLTSPPVKQRSKNKRKQSSSSDQDSPAVPSSKSKNQSLTQAQTLSDTLHTGHNSTAIQDHGDRFTEPNPAKPRKAHPKQSIQAALSSVPKFELKKKVEEKLPLFSAPPPLLSPIKSPKNPKSKVSQARSKSMLAAEASTASPTSAASTASPVSSTSSASSARERIKSASLAPVTVEAPVKSVGGKLNPTQLEAARRRAVPSSATTLAPSVDGFRQSSKTGKAALTAKTEVKKTGKVSEELLYCPSRKRTNPLKITNSAETKTEPAVAVVKTEARAASDHPDKVKSKELISTEQDKTKLASEDNDPIAPAAESKESLKIQNITEPETLDGDLTVSDSEDDEEVDEKPIPTNMSQPSDEFFESDEEHDRKGRFSKLVSEKQEVEIAAPDLSESKPLVADEKAHGVNKAPEKPKVFETLLEETIHSFRVRIEKQYQDLQANRQKLSRERSEMLYDATVDCLRKNFRNLMGCQNEESFNKLVSSVASANNPQNEAMICDLVYEYLKSEHKDTPLLSEADSEQPPITRKQQRLFALLTTLSKLDRYSGIMERMIALLWHNLFGRDRMYNLKLNAVQNTGRMFILCARFCDNIEIVKNFIYDLFYFKSPRNHILIGIVIALWPQVFPNQGEPLSQTPMMETIVWCVFNTGPEVYSPEMMVNETKEIMEKDYNYRPSSHKAEELVIRFLKLAEDNGGDTPLLEEITRSLLLLGRARDYRWVQNNIFTRLMKLLGEVWSQSEGQGGFLGWVITSLGLLSRVYPAEGREQLRGIYQPVEQLLTNGGLDPDTENASLVSLFHLGFHMQTQVAQFLKTWRPKHPLRERTRRLIEDFLGTRGKKYAEITEKVVRIERNKARKRKGVK